MLRHRNGDTRVAEQPPDGAVHIRAHIVDAILRVGNPEAQFQIHAKVCKLHQACDRRWLMQYPPVPGGGVQQQCQRNFRIVAVTDAHRQLQSHLAIRVAPVDDRVGDQVLVGHQRFHAIAIADHDVTAAQLLHPAKILGAGAGHAGETDDIARLDRLIEQQHEAADKVAGDGLQAEPQPQTDRAGQYGERREINAGGIDAQQRAQADQEKVAELGNANACGHRHGVDAHDAPLDGAGDDAHDHDETCDDYQALEERPE